MLAKTTTGGNSGIRGYLSLSGWHGRVQDGSPDREAVILMYIERALTAGDTDVRRRFI
jgi:hypothetical protein